MLYTSIKMIEPLSKEFLLARGYCCESNCVNCPYRKCSKCNGMFTCDIEIGKDKCWCMEYEPVTINTDEDKCMCSRCLQEQLTKK